MWQHIKIPLRTPKSKVYEVVNSESQKNVPLSEQMEAVYPKLVKQIHFVKKQLKEAVTGLKKSNEINEDLSQNLSQNSGEQEKLNKQIENLQNKIKKLEEELKNRPTQTIEGGSQTSESEEGLAESILHSDVKEYADVDEKLMDEHGQPGEESYYG